MRFALLLVLTIGATTPALAQDPVFSQFFAAPLQINPAFAGATYAPRITMNYRNQWPSWPNAYVTYAAAYEQPLEMVNSGLGLIAMADVAGDGIYQTNRFGAVYSYQVRISDAWALKFGVEAGMIQTRVDWDQLVFLDQLNPLTGATDGEGNFNITEELRPGDLSKTTFDVSAGFLAYGRNFYGGLSVKHLNRPDDRLFEVNDNLSVGMPLRFTVHGGVEIALERSNNRNAPTFISPNVLYVQQGDFGQINAGAYMGLGQIFGGLWYRHSFGNPDAAIALIGYRYGVLRIGYSYDVTISGLSNALTGGSHEISVTFSFEDSNRLQARRQRSRYSDCFKMFN